MYSATIDTPNNEKTLASVNYMNSFINCTFIVPRLNKLENVITMCVNIPIHRIEFNEELISKHANITQQSFTASKIVYNTENTYRVTTNVIITTCVDFGLDREMALTLVSTSASKRFWHQSSFLL